MCFLHKHMQNFDFGQILCRRASTKRHVTSRPMVRFSQNWYQKVRKTWKKKVMERRVAICGGREAVADFVQGESNWPPPPPPVKIGLNGHSHTEWNSKLTTNLNKYEMQINDIT